MSNDHLIRKNHTGEPGNGGEFGIHSHTGDDITLNAAAPIRPHADLTPADVDAALAILYQERDRIDTRIQLVDATQKRNDNYLERGYMDADAHQKATEKNDAEKAPLEAELERVQDTIDGYDDEFDARGGWSRFYIVQNGNGHVHSSRYCKSCNPRTRFGRLYDQSGKDEAGIVEAAGDAACTFCFPTAPVVDRAHPRPNSLMTPEERQEKADRDAAKTAKATKAAAAAISHPDGLPVKAYSYNQVLKTEPAAQIDAVDFLFYNALDGGWRGAWARDVPLRKLGDVQQKHVAERVREDWESQDQFDLRNQEDLDGVANFVHTVEALAHKRGVDAEELRNDLQVKAEKRK